MYKTKIGNDILEIKTEGFADQANGCCMIQMGETAILCTSTMGRERTDIDFFPLSCDYEEKYYAAGKILGSRFMRREGRPSNHAILSGRLIDHAIRPLFPEGMKREIQSVSTCLSWDNDNDPITLALNGASISLTISNIPFNGPLGTVRIGKSEDGFILNPNYEERESGKFDLVLSGVEKDGDILINMIEFEGDEEKEESLIKATEFAKPYIKELIDFQLDLQKKIGKEKVIIAEKDDIADLRSDVGRHRKDIEKALYQKSKELMYSSLSEVKDKILAEIEESYGPERLKDADSIFEQEKEDIFKKGVLENEKRPDGRKLDEVRKITPEVDILPRNHGSAIFTRGETRALGVLTLGSPGDELLLDGMEKSGKIRFLLHYNFPAYSVGEVKPNRGPGRREIGHGALAEKTLKPLIPDFDEFPYTIRVVSEILTSNGSSSMASVSACCLALLDGGVPIKEHAAGIAIGLVTGENGEYKILTDIQGPEDHSGEMDLKVAGTLNGINAIQMDVKTVGITVEMMSEAFERAKDARTHIIGEQKKVINSPREKLSKFAPKVYTINIDPDKIGMVIGSGGKVINEIIEKCEVAIDIEDDGRIFISGESEENANKAIDWIKGLTKEAKVGEMYDGEVKRILNFGAMVEIFPGQDGMVHISEFADFRINKVEDVVKIGDKIPVQVIEIDNQGRVNLSAKKAGFKAKPPKSNNGK